MMTKLVIYTCPRGCGWSRPYNDCADFLDRSITHPLYGMISGRALVSVEISTHDCYEHLEARKRLAERMRNAQDREQSKANV